LIIPKKNYQNLIEVLANNAIYAAASNPTLLLPQSSSTFPNPFDQNNIYRIGESEYYHNSKGDIAD
jgi:hypothetical protein